MVVSQDAVPMAVPSGDTLREETLFSWPIIIINSSIIIFLAPTKEPKESLCPSVRLSVRPKVG